MFLIVSRMGVLKSRSETANWILSTHNSLNVAEQNDPNGDHMIFSVIAECLVCPTFVHLP